MMGWFGKHARRRRIEAQAQAWVVRIDEDRAHHEPGLRRWIGADHERADIYNHAWRAFQDAAAPAAAIYGNARRRGAVAQARGMRAIPYARLVVITAVLVLMGVAAALIVSRLAGDHPLRSGFQPASAPTIITTDVGEMRTLRLSDGSRIVLDTHSRMVVDFTGAIRSVTLLEGRARFEVFHDPNRPFVVSAGGGTVTARGTVFDVDLRGKVGVHLISGMIDVRYPVAAGRSPPVQHLTAGQKVSFAANSPSAIVQPIPATKADGQWITGMETFDDVPVSTIIEEANRYASRRIVLDAPGVADQLVFMDVDIRDSSGVARKLASLLDLRVDESGSDVIRLTPIR